MSTICKMIGWFFIEMYELLTGKRKLMDESNPEDDPDPEDDDSEEDEP